ncbi:hypothetical protein SLEP1_g70 [Rubroshorea leprosula]|uniref:Uncharacterized protein n=1 Tax=Rubroshorea leprosula TaxID=152421 RepID=A0AAV5HE30_9ROSI|nr:hypothetical protein SLEP1_g70 [Rubroshorea leprosula]
MCADRLAAMAHSQQEDFVILEGCPSTLFMYLYADMLGTIELGDTLNLESSLRLSCKALRLILGVDTLILKSTIVRATSYESRVKAEFEVDFPYLSEVDPEGTNAEQEQRGRTRIRLSSLSFNRIEVVRCRGLLRMSEVAHLRQPWSTQLRTDNMPHLVTSDILRASDIS